MDTHTEAFMPVLSAGRHRSANRGACFMEYASYLAGLRWSDHPSCTHPTLAGLARLVNDLTSDSSRPRLAGYVPSVVGVTGDDARVPLVLCALAASAALPVANQSRQRALATALVRCDELLREFDGSEIDRARGRIRAAFLLAPGTEEWARAFLGTDALRAPIPLSVNEDAILRTSVIGIADACVADADARLEELLVSAIDEARGILLHVAPTTPPAKVEGQPLEPRDVHETMRILA